MIPLCRLVCGRITFGEASVLGIGIRFVSHGQLSVVHAKQVPFTMEGTSLGLRNVATVGGPLKGGRARRRYDENTDTPDGARESRR